VAPFATVTVGLAETDPAPLRTRVPALTVVAPVWVFAAVSVCVPAPAFVTDPAPAMTPAYVAPSPSLIVSAPPLDRFTLPIDVAVPWARPPTASDPAFTFAVPPAYRVSRPAADAAPPASTLSVPVPPGVVLVPPSRRFPVADREDPAPVTVIVPDEPALAPKNAFPEVTVPPLRTVRLAVPD
jgi:hypothetical protein